MNAKGRKLRWNGAGVALVCILALGAFTSFYKLGAKSLWFDEITGGRVADLRTVKDIWAAGDMDSHPPAMALAEHGSRWTFGLSEWSLRMPAALASTLALGLVVAIGAAWGYAWSGRLAAVLAAFSPTFVLYAQNARPYALAMLFSAGATVCFLNAFRRGRLYVWLPLYAAFAVLAFYTHYFTTVIVGTHFLIAAAAWLGVFRPERWSRTRSYTLVFSLFVVAVAAAAAAAYPVFAKALYDRGRFPGSEMSLTPAVAWGALASVGWDRVTANGLFAVAAVAGVIYLWRKQGGFAGAAAFCLITVPIFLPLIVIRLTTQFWHTRFCYFAFPAFMVVAAFGFVATARALVSALRSSPRPAFVVLTVVMLGGVVKAVNEDAIALRVYYTNEQQDFRGAVAFINRNRDWRSVQLVWPFRNEDCFTFYTKTLGGPAAVTRPREVIRKYFEGEDRVFLMSTDAEFADQILESYPTTLRFRFTRVDVLYHDPSYEDAGAVFRGLRCDLVGAQGGMLNNALARLALARGERDLAFKYFKIAARECDAENPDIFNLTDLYAARGDDATALKIIGGYVRRHPDEAWPYTKLAVVYLKTCDNNSAIAFYRRALWLEPYKKGWRESCERLIANRKIFRALFGYSDPRWS